MKFARCGSLLWLLTCACQRSSSEASFLAPGATELGSRAFGIRLADQVLVVATAEDGVDRNGDGDGGDSLLEVTDLRSGRRTLTFDELSFATGGGFVSFSASESARGSDLNGDGDQLDAVVCVLDARRGTLANLGLAIGPSDLLVQDGALLAFAVDEVQQGRDLDGDGRALDLLAFVYRADRRRLTLLGVPVVAARGLYVSGERVVVVSPEGPGRDLNADGDEDDDVVQVHDSRTGATHNLAISTSGILGLDGELLAFFAVERDQGGSGFTVFLELYDLETGRLRGSLTNTHDARVGGDLLFEASDEGYGFYDRITNALSAFGTRPSVLWPSLDDRRAAYLVEEYTESRDLNGDGDELDAVLHTFDGRTGQETNERVAVAHEQAPPEFDGAQIAFLSSPALDSRDPLASRELTVRLLDVRTGAARDLGIPADQLRLADELLVLLVPEARRGVDLDGDGDLADWVVEVHNTRSGRTLMSGLACSPAAFEDFLAVDGNTVVFSASEESQGRDLDGDGDRLDEVVFALRVP